MCSLSFGKSSSFSLEHVCSVCSPRINKNIGDIPVIYSQDTQCRYICKFVAFVLNLKIFWQIFLCITMLESNGIDFWYHLEKAVCQMINCNAENAGKSPV